MNFPACVAEHWAFIDYFLIKSKHTWLLKCGQNVFLPGASAPVQGTDQY